MGKKDDKKKKEVVKIRRMTRYEAEGRCQKNKARKLRKHLKRLPRDWQARGALEKL